MRSLDDPLAPFSQAAADVIAPYAPIIEIGAGTGDWCQGLVKAGVECQGFDIAPGAMHVEQGSHLVAAAQGDKTLLAVWPPSEIELARWVEAGSWPHVIVVGDMSRFIIDLPGYAQVMETAMPPGRKGRNTLRVYERSDLI